MSQQHYDADAFLSGGGIPSAKFDSPGATVAGHVTEPAPEVRQQTDFRSGAPLTWDKGDPKLQLVVTLQTTQQDNPDDDGRRRIYVRGSKKPESQSMHAAIAAAVQTAGAKGLEVGGWLQVTYTGDGEANGNLNAPKKYTAEYKKPDTTAASGEFLGTQPPQQPTQEQATGGYTPEQIAAIKAAGLDPDQLKRSA